MWSAAIILGLASSLHCVGMCGPIALALPLNRKSESSKVLGLLSYNVGRILSYASLGLIFGALGKGLYIFTQQQWLSIGAGVLMLIMAFLPGSIQFFSGKHRWFIRFQQSWKNVTAKFFKRNSLKSLFSIGILNGFLPCGMVYAALAGALASSSVLGGIYFMLFFGLGTVPLMFGLAYAGDLINLKQRLRFQKMIPIMLGLVGIMLIIRGLGLDLGHFSPSVLANQAFIAICG